MRKFKITLAAAAAALGMAAVSTAAHAATNFFGDYNVTLNTADSGLLVGYQPITPDVNGLNFFLDPGQSTTINLFNLYTPESTVNPGDDLGTNPIQVAFSFSLPTIFGGSVDGVTQGNGTLHTFLGHLFVTNQSASVTWDNGGEQELDFGAGGKLDVALNDATFGQQFLGLGLNTKNAATIAATFSYISAPSAAPEPGVWGLMILGTGLAGTMLRRQRRQIQAVA